MPIMTFDLEDGKPPVSFSINTEGAERFMDLMAEYTEGLKDAERFRKLRRHLSTSTAFDRYPGYHHCVAFYDDKKLGFEAAIDAMKE